MNNICKTLVICGLILNANTIILANEALIMQAESGNAQAQFEVAELYSSGKLGNNTQEDKDIALKWLEKSAEQGYIKSQEALCDYFLSKCKYEKAFKWAKSAMKQGSIKAKSAMAVLNYIGKGVTSIDRTKAFSLLKESESEPLSKALLGIYYTTGWFDIETDYQKAKLLAKEAINLNCIMGYETYALASIKEFLENPKPELQSELLKYSEEGLAKYPDSEDLKLVLAMSLLLNPNKNNLSRAQNLLNEIKEEGLGSAKFIYSQYEMIMQNNDKAVSYIFESADLGYLDAIPLAFELYVFGQSVIGLSTEPNLDKAVPLVINGLKTHNPEFLGVYYPVMKMASKDETYKENLKAVYLEDFDYNKYLKIAADNGCPSMMYLYSKKKNISKEERLKYLFGSANMGWVDAIQDIANMYYQEKNEKAYEWALKAETQKRLQHKLNKDSLCCKDAFLVQGLCLLNGVCGAKKDVKKGLEKLSSYFILGGEQKISFQLFKEYSAFEETEQNLIDAYFWGYINVSITKDPTGTTKRDIENYLENVKSKLPKETIDKIEQECSKIIELNKKNFKNNLIDRITYYGSPKI